MHRENLAYEKEVDTMISFFQARCSLCQRPTRQHCAHCHTPICTQCRVVEHGKSYCSTRHRDSDSGVGRLLRRFQQSLR